jgi:hypothetical protein
METLFEGRSRRGCLARAEFSNFSANLQLFVPFAQKDARLARRAYQAATDLSES